jgi:hypothetical protein
MLSCVNFCGLKVTRLVLGANNISADPTFVNKDAGNWRLAQGSPCINTGLNEARMDSAADLDGHHRIGNFTRLVDMGCFEYLPAGSMYLVGF